jgi:hypothetical protein
MIDHAPLTQSDDNTTIRARCPQCKRVAYSVDKIGTRCNHLGADGRKCIGIFEGGMNDKEMSDITINGDKVIEFSKAVRGLADLFESMNIVGIKELFLMGRKCESIESIIELQNKWNKALRIVGDELEKRGIQLAREEDGLKRSIEILDQGIKMSNSNTFAKAIAHLQEFTTLCDRLDAHRKSGTLDIIAQLTKDH